MANIVDPVEMLMNMATSTLLPMAKSTHKAAPLPTVIPDIPEFQKVHHDGKVTLWVVFVIMLIATIVFTGLSWRVPINKRLYHFLTTMITIIATISYFAMATGHGVSYHHIRVTESHDTVPDTHKDIYRQVFWARYVDWSLTTPLLLLDLCFLAGLSGAYILFAVAADITMILTGLFAAFGAEETAQKWGWYAMSCIAYLVILWQLIVNGRVASQAKGGKASKFFTSIAGFTLIIWTAYPIVWGIADGGRHVGVDGEIIAYAVLDVLAKPIFGLWLLITHSRLPETNIELGGFWSSGLSTSGGGIRLTDDDEGA